MSVLTQQWSADEKRSWVAKSADNYHPGLLRNWPPIELDRGCWVANPTHDVSSVACSCGSNSSRNYCHTNDAEGIWFNQCPSAAKLSPFLLFEAPLHKPLPSQFCDEHFSLSNTVAILGRMIMRVDRNQSKLVFYRKKEKKRIATVKNLLTCVDNSSMLVQITVRFMPSGPHVGKQVCMPPKRVYTHLDVIP